MKKNKQDERQQAITALEKELDDVRDAIWKQGWIELETPIHRGWNAEHVVRPDLARGKHGPALQEVLDVCGETIYSRRKDFKKKSYRTKKWIVETPGFHNISKKEYEKLSREAKGYFWYDDNPKYSRNPYKCIVEKWKFEIKISKNYLTHYREHDEVLYQWEAELNAKIYGEYYGEVWGSYGSTAFWRNYEERKVRGKSKKLCRDVVSAYNNHLGEYGEYIFPLKQKNAYWYW